MVIEPKPGVYKHYKGGLYQFNTIAGSSDDDTDGMLMVVYTCLYTSKGTPFVRVRTLASWNEPVKWPNLGSGGMQPRFVHISAGVGGPLPHGA